MSLDAFMNELIRFVTDAGVLPVAKVGVAFSVFLIAIGILFSWWRGRE